MYFYFALDALMIERTKEELDNLDVNEKKTFGLKYSLDIPRGLDVFCLDDEKTHFRFKSLNELQKL